MRFNYQKERVVQLHLNKTTGKQSNHLSADISINRFMITISKANFVLTSYTYICHKVLTLALSYSGSFNLTYVHSCQYNFCI